MEKTYGIGIFANLTGIPVRTLHYYDEVGLLKPRRLPSGHRTYEPDDIITLQKIVSLKTMGFSLERIKEFLQHPTYDLSLVEVLKLQRESLEAARAELDQSLDMIARITAILQHEEQLDHQLLFNLIHNMSHEGKQREWVAGHLSEHTATALFSLSPEAVAELDAEMVQFTKAVKKLCKGPCDSQEAETAIGACVKRAFTFLNEEAIANFSKLDEQQFAEVDQLVEMPFNEEETVWLDAALAHYLNKYGIVKEGRVIWTE